MKARYWLFPTLTPTRGYLCFSFVNWAVSALSKACVQYRMTGYTSEVRDLSLPLEKPRTLYLRRPHQILLSYREPLRFFKLQLLNVAIKNKSRVKTELWWSKSQQESSCFKIEKHTWGYIPRTWLNSILELSQTRRLVRCLLSSWVSWLLIGSSHFFHLHYAALNVLTLTYIGRTRHDEQPFLASIISV